MPHVVQFDSAEHLANLLLSLTKEDLMKISNHMLDYSEKVREELAQVWTDIHKLGHWTEQETGSN